MVGLLTGALAEVLSVYSKGDPGLIKKQSLFSKLNQEWIGIYVHQFRVGVWSGHKETNPTNCCKFECNYKCKHCIRSYG